MIDQFGKDVDEGFASHPKHLSSRYFYDDNGSKLFQQIMRMPEYYLTDCEFEIFSTQTKEIVETMSAGNKKVRLIDLGAGDGIKTMLLLEGFKESGVEVIYTPVDISKEAIRAVEENIKRKLPDTKIEPLQGEYYTAIAEMDKIYTHLPKVALFLGSNIGNFSNEEALDFLSQIRALFAEGDKLFIGFDLKKDAQTVLNAYSDKAGITKKFNINLLKRINRELGADFKLDQFEHYATYDPVSGTAKSFIISKVNQNVYIKSLDKTYLFDRFEPIQIEQSQKYDLKMVSDLSVASRFKILQNFFDCKHFYLNSLWEL